MVSTVPQFQENNISLGLLVILANRFQIHAAGNGGCGWHVAACHISAQYLINTIVLVSVKLNSASVAVNYAFGMATHWE